MRESEAIALAQIEFARSIGGEPLAWGVAFGLRWERRRWEHMIDEGLSFGLHRRPAPPELNAGGRLAHRVIRVARAARRAWEGRA